MVNFYGGSFTKIDDADYVIVHLKTIANNKILENKNVVNCKFVIDSALNLKIPEENINMYKHFAE